jgi:hypothetical protein
MHRAASHRELVEDLLRNPARLRLSPTVFAEILRDVLPHLSEEACARIHEQLSRHWPVASPSVRLQATAGASPTTALDSEAERRRLLGDHVVGAQAWQLLDVHVSDPPIPGKIVDVLSQSMGPNALLLDPGISLVDFQERFNANVKDEFGFRMDDATKAKEISHIKHAHPQWRLVPCAIEPGTQDLERNAQLDLLETSGLKPSHARDLVFLTGLYERMIGERFFSFIYTRCQEEGILVGLSRAYAYSIRSNDDGGPKGNVGMAGIPALDCP